MNGGLQAGATPTPDEVAATLGSGINALDSCVTALYVAARFVPQDFASLIDFVQRMGGDIWVQSRVGYGSRFTLRIPAEVAEPREPVSVVGAREDLENWVPSPSWRILVVEDTLEHQKLIYSCLRRS